MNAQERAEIQSVIKGIEGEIKRLKALLPAPVKPKRYGVTVTQGPGAPKSKYRPGRGPKGHGMGSDGKQQ